MAFTWTLSAIRTEFRHLTGRSTTGEISDADCNNWINEYYTNYFPEEAGVHNFQTDLSQAVTPTDSGEYSLAQTVIAVEEPATIDGQRIALFTDKEQFFNLYPDNERYITAPTLAIGSGDTAKVANSSFRYQIGQYAYEKAAAETALSGSVVPANLYGAWMLTIDADGTIAVTEASDNATGYASPGLALNALQGEHTSDCVMGYVTVIHTSTFTPGTTALDTAGVTDTYTDGSPGNRSLPEAALIYGNKLHLRPKSSDWHQFEAQMSLQRPTALANDGAAPLDIKWGRILAVGAAILFIAKKEADTERLMELQRDGRSLLSSIKSKRLIQWSRDQRTCQPSF